MIIQNETLKALLEEKKGIVEEGRKLSEEIEVKARPINDKLLSEKGVKIEGDVYSGSYELLKMAFSLESMSVIGETVKAALSEELELMNAKQMQLDRINDQVNKEITDTVLPTVTLGEFEQITTIELTPEGVELKVVDVLEEFKMRYLKAKK